MVSPNFISLSKCLTLSMQHPLRLLLCFLHPFEDDLKAALLEAGGCPDGLLGSSHACLSCPVPLTAHVKAESSTVLGQ